MCRFVTPGLTIFNRKTLLLLIIANDFGQCFLYIANVEELFLFTKKLS
jgi:hypothetical protein